MMRDLLLPNRLTIQPIIPGYNPQLMKIGDVDGDSQPELIVSDFEGNIAVIKVMRD